MRFLPVLFVLPLVFACGDEDGSNSPDVSTNIRDAGADAGADAGSDAGTDSGIDPDGCRVLTLGPRDFQFNLFGQLTGLVYPVTPNIDDDLTDRLLIELYDSFTGGL